MKVWVPSPYDSADARFELAEGQVLTPGVVLLPRQSGAYMKPVPMVIAWEMTRLSPSPGARAPDATCSGVAALFETGRGSGPVQRSLLQHQSLPVSWGLPVIRLLGAFCKRAAESEE